MKILKIISSLQLKSLLVLAGAFVFILISNLPSMGNNSGVSAPAGVKTDLEKARKEGRLVFLIITDNLVTKAEKAVKIAHEASSKIEKSMVLSINRDEPDNKNLVAQYSIASVELPFILMISPKGIAVGGFPEKGVTVDMLLKGVPSPGQEELLTAINQKKPTFIVVSKSGTPDRETVTTLCKNTSAKMAPKASIIEVDFENPAETGFLKQLGVTAINDKSMIIVTNNSGKVTDKYTGLTDESKLMSSAYKQIKSGGCCPGGSKSGCGSSSSSGCAPKK